MALIVQAGDPVLRTPAKLVPAELLGTKPLHDLVAEMVKTMREAPGVGLAAPQIGIPWQLIVVEDDAERMAKLDEKERDDRARAALPLTAIVNPELKIVGDATATFFEGCLSIDGWSALVPRALNVEVSGLTPDGQPVALKLTGWPARILQHEVDHLRGTLYIDRMHSRSFSLSEGTGRWKNAPAEEIAKTLGFSLADR